MSILKTLSGIVLNQNSPPQEDTDLSRYSVSTDWLYQDFFLGPDYQRGSDSDELSIPPLSGIQILVEPFPDINTDHATVDYKLEYDEFGEGWIELASGTSIGVLSASRSWMNCFFDKQVPLTLDQAQSRFRIAIRSRQPVLDETGLPFVSQTAVYYDGLAIIINGRRVEVGALVEDKPYIFEDQGIPVFVRWNGAEETVFYAYQQPIRYWYVSIPNPLQGYSGSHASDGTSPLTLLNKGFSFCFRILGLVGDEGSDFLGNRYRSSVRQNKTENLNTIATNRDSYWLSRPYPSKFAVESLYFDISNDGSPSIVDQILIDPTTPGVFFNVYHSNEGDPATTEMNWEYKLWTHVPQTYQMTSRQTHRLPTPIGAKYMKIEFSHLQAQYYAAGLFQAPIRYSKYPKWVLDYFLARMATESLNTNGIIGSNINVVFDAIDLAYKYYLDDLRTDVTPDVTTVASFLQSRGDFSDQVDPVTLSNINLVMNPYLSNPALNVDIRTLLGQSARASVTNATSYPTENRVDLSLSSQDVSTLNRESILVEQSFPSMFFFLTSRHRYRKVDASFENDTAYFAGVRELAFLHDDYVAEYDASAYIEINTDTLRVEQNDFLLNG